MNKKLLVAAIVSSVLLINSNLCANAISAETRDVSSPADLNTATLNPNNKGVVEINLKNDVTVTKAIGAPGSTSFKVYGNGYALDGNKALPADTHGQFAGFNIGTGKNLEIRNTILKNFYIAGNGGAINNTGSLNVYNSTFSGNNDTGTGYGGAIYNTGTLNIYNSTFSKNKANRSAGIYNGDTTANLKIYNSDFSENTSAASGGVFTSQGGGTASIYNSTFAGNITTGPGGVICNNYGTYTIYNSSFTNNRAGTVGGVIFNQFTLNLIADGGNVVFTGNKANNVSNAIHSNSGTTNLNAGFGEVIINDGITSESGGVGSKLNINMTGLWDVNTNPNNPARGSIPTTAPTSGRIILNNALTGFNNTNDLISLYNTGSLKVGILKDTDGNILQRGSIGASGARITQFTMSNNAILNLANGKADDVVYVNSFKTTDNTSIWTDVDVTGGVADQLNLTSVDGTSSGKLSLKTLRMLNEGNTNTAKVFSGAKLSSAIVDVANTYTNNYNYGVVYNNTTGNLELTRNIPTAGAGKGLLDAIAATGERSFSLVGSDNVVGTGLPNLTSGTLTAFGDGIGTGAHAISGGDDNLSGNFNLFTVDSGATLNIVDAILKNANSSGVDGGAINNLGTLNIYDSLLTNNKSTFAVGGAIYNAGTTYIANSKFTGNNSGTSQGGAIANSGAGHTVSINHSIFTQNNSGNNSGGAIYNTANAILNVADSTFGGMSVGNSAGSGGAICNLATANIYNSIFIDNSANASSGTGGAIVSDGATVTTNIYNSTFTNNNANSGYGGAIANTGGATANIYSSTFGGDPAGATTYGNWANYGGAIDNESSTTNIYDSTFKYNAATFNGGAIYSDGGTVNLIADKKEVIFTGNKAAGVDNDVFLTNNAKLNLNAALGNKITLGGGIKSNSVATGTININNLHSADPTTPPTGAPTNGEVVLGAPIETSTVNLYGGTLTLNQDTYLNGDNLVLNGGTINMQNGQVGIMTVNKLGVNDLPNLKIDADLAAGTSDTINGSPFEPEGKLNVSSIKILHDSTTNSTTTQLLGDGLKNKNIVTLGITKAYSPVYAYDVSYNDTTGQLTFAGGGGNSYNNYNPAVTSAGVAAQTGGFTGALATYNEVLSRIDQPMLDMTMLHSQLGYDPKLLNKTAASAGQPEFSPLMDSTKEPAAWFRPFTSFENVPLDNGPTVHSVSYGGLIGGDSNLKEFGHGYQGVITGYGGYTGSHQTYNGVSLFQNGGYGGLMGTLYKGNFFTALTANVGASNVSSNSSPDFGMLNAGLASRTGYNLNMMHSKLILQPNYMMSYTFVGTQDYTNNQGVKISTDALNAMQIVPGAKLILNLNHGWQPYLSTNMVWNILDESKVKANDVSLPEVSVDPYVEYGVGVQKKWGERFTGFFQSMIRNGGRNGISLIAGFKWTI